MRQFIGVWWLQLWMLVFWIEKTSKVKKVSLF